IRADPEHPGRRRARHVPRPDFAVFQRRRLMTLLDAKYRDLWETDLPRDMLYQLALYAAAHEGGTAAILYPTEHLDAREERLTIHDPSGDGVRATIALRPVDVRRLEELINAPVTAGLVRERARFAGALVGGA